MRLIDADTLMKDLVDAIASQKRWMDSAKKSNSGMLPLAQQAYFTLLECKQHLAKAPTITTSAQPEPLTDKEQRIFLAAMGREEKVCEEVDRNHAREPYEDSLMRVCKEIRRKVKGALWT